MEVAQVQALMAGDKQAFEQLVQALMSPQNESRQAAEGLFNQLKDNAPDLIATNLIAVLRTAQQQDSRTFSAVLLRKARTYHYHNVRVAVIPHAAMLRCELPEQILTCQPSLAGADEG